MQLKNIPLRLTTSRDFKVQVQCGSPYLAYWNWPFPARSMPGFPWSARAESGYNRRTCLIREGSHRPGTHTSEPRFGRGPRRQPTVGVPLCAPLGIGVLRHSVQRAP